MKYHPINPDLFVENRKRLCALLPPKSLVIVHANDLMPLNADGLLPFRQNSDLLHLSGVDQEETILVLFPDACNEKQRELLFVRETSEEIAIWEGAKLTKEKATEVSGIERVHWLTDFPVHFKQLMAEADQVFLNSNEHPRANTPVESREHRFIFDCQRQFPLHRYERLAPLMHRLRSIKSPIEVDVLKKACEITEKGFRRVLSFIKPGVQEFEVEAEYMHEFLLARSKGFAYPPIIASGGNACVLHYVENDQPCQDGDLLLMDVAAEYANYNADMTRTVPVSGKFTDRQRQVYDAVHRALNFANSLLKPGILIKDYQEEVGRFIQGELLDLGLLEQKDIDDEDPEKPAYKKYFMHGTSHHLGLDVHDVGGAHHPVEAGMVYTIEPGIYIREENLGVRLENDYVVTESGENINLMETIPIEAEEIESIMQDR